MPQITLLQIAKIKHFVPISTDFSKKRRDCRWWSGGRFETHAW